MIRANISLFTYSRVYTLLLDMRVGTGRKRDGKSGSDTVAAGRRTKAIVPPSGSKRRLVIGIFGSVEGPKDSLWGPFGAYYNFQRFQ